MIQFGGGEARRKLLGGRSGEQHEKGDRWKGGKKGFCKGEDGHRCTLEDVGESLQDDANRQIVWIYEIPGKTAVVRAGEDDEEGNGDDNNDEVLEG